MCFLAALAALVLTSTARAQESPAQIAQQDVAAALRDNDPERAFEVIDAAPISGVDKAFLAGNVLQAQGRHGEAADLFAQVLRARPDLVPFRQALIRSLIALGDLGAAISQLDTLLQDEDDPNERARLLRTRAALDARRPGGLTFGVNVTPSTNVNRATSNIEAPALGGLGTGTIDETRESGVGLTLSFGGFRRVFLDNGRVLEGSLNVAATVFSDSIYNRQVLTGTLAYVVPTERGRWLTRAQISEYLYRDDTDRARRFILSQSRRWVTGADRLWELTGTVLKTDYRDPSRDGFDSYGLDLSVLTRKALGPTSWLSLIAGVERNWAEDDRFSYIAPRIGFEVGGRVGDGWILSAGPLFTYRPYDEDFGVSFDFARRDKVGAIRLSVQNTNFRVRGAVPRLGCLVERTTSNIVFYDNRNVVECSVSLSRQF